MPAPRPAARLRRAGCQPRHSAQHGSEVAGACPTHHDGDLRERRRGGGSEHRSPHVVKRHRCGQKGSLCPSLIGVVSAAIDKPDYPPHGGLRYQCCPAKSAREEPVGRDNHDRKIALLILHIPGRWRSLLGRFLSEGCGLAYRLCAQAAGAGTSLARETGRMSICNLKKNLAVDSLQMQRRMISNAISNCSSRWARATTPTAGGGAKVPVLSKVKTEPIFVACRVASVRLHAIPAIRGLTCN